jgi:hypothetical protein
MANPSEPAPTGAAIEKAGSKGSHSIILPFVKTIASADILER